MPAYATNTTEEQPVQQYGYGGLKIPRILHSFNLGEGPLSTQETSHLEKWVNLHPEWKLYHWTRDHLPSDLPMPQQSAAWEWSESTEAVKYGALHQYGGICLDAGVECVQNLEPLLDGVNVFFAYEESREVSKAVVGAVPSHNLIAAIFRDIRLGLSGSGLASDPSKGELLHRAIAEYLGDHTQGIRLEVAKSGREIGGLFEGDLVIFEPWVFFHSKAALSGEEGADSEYFGIDQRDEMPRTVSFSSLSNHEVLPTRQYNGGTDPCLAIVIPTLNRADMLRESLTALTQQLTTHEHLFVIDNGRQGLAVHSENATVLEQPLNLGVAASWNLGLVLALRSIETTHVLVLNDDIALAEDQLKKIRGVLKNNPDRWLFVGSYYWSVWAISRRGAQLMQLDSGEFFDQKFFPAYFEDNDFYYRFTSLYPKRYLPDIPEFLPAVCRNAMTAAKEPRLNVRFEKNHSYYVEKWGGPPGAELIPVDKISKGGVPSTVQAANIFDNYLAACTNPSDIFEHLPTLKSYAEECRHITEFGVRTVVSTWALLAARPAILRSFDLVYHETVAKAQRCAATEGVDFEFQQQDVHADDFHIQETEMLFIDTLHTYASLTTELSKHANQVTKYLIIHDTVTFGRTDEGNPAGRGLLPAIDEFLSKNCTWTRHDEYFNNNGLTILHRETFVNPLSVYFRQNGKRLIHKWDHYFAIYHKHLQKFRHTNVAIMEVGVSHRDSLFVWKDYFGSTASIIGIDVDPRCKRLEAEGIRIWIGDQEDAQFWRRVKRTIPRLDILISGGRHTMTKMRATFEEMYDFVSAGGVYLVEDAHACHRKEFGGALRQSESFVEYAKNLLDQLNGNYKVSADHNAIPRFDRTTLSVSFYDGVIVFEKGNRGDPLYSATGTTSLLTFPHASAALGPT